MAIIERTRPYETLIRHHPDGGIGAHHIEIAEVLRDGHVITAQLLPAQPVEGAGLDAVLGAATVAALADAAARAGQVERLLEQIETLQEQVAQLAGAPQY